MELGASIGIISREILQKLEIGRKLVSVEALPFLAAVARKNLLSLKDPDDCWKVIEGAIAYNSSHVAFQLGPQHNMGRISKAGGNPQPPYSEASVQVATLSLACALSHVRKGPYSLVMDIEGAEYEIIEE